MKAIINNLNEQQLKQMESFINDYAYEEINRYKYLREDFNSNRTECINYMIYHYFTDFIFEQYYLDFIENNSTSRELGEALVRLQILHKNHKMLVSFIQHLIPNFDDFMEEEWINIPTYVDLSNVRDGFLPDIYPGNCLRNDKLLYKVVYSNMTVIYGDVEYRLFLQYQDNEVVNRAWTKLLDYFILNEELAKEVRESLK